MRRAALALMLVLAACRDEPPPAQNAAAMPTPTPSPSPTRSLAPGELPAPELDAAGAMAMGEWTFRASATGAAALFGDPRGDALFAVRCDPQARRIVLARAGRATDPVSLRIATDMAAATFPAVARTDPPMVEAAVPVGLTFLTALADARERIGVTVGDGPAFVMPGDAAIGRVIAGCRPDRGVAAR